MFFVYQGGNSIAMSVDLTYVMLNVCVCGWLNGSYCWTL